MFDTCKFQVLRHPKHKPLNGLLCFKEKLAVAFFYSSLIYTTFILSHYFVKNWSNLIEKEEGIVTGMWKQFIQHRSITFCLHHALNTIFSRMYLVALLAAQTRLYLEWLSLGQWDFPSDVKYDLSKHLNCMLCGSTLEGESSIPLTLSYIFILYSLVN